MREKMKAFVWPFRSVRYALGYLLLIGLGYAGNEWTLSLNFGIHYYFGNLFLLLAAVIFGPLWGAAAAAAVVTLCSATGDYSPLHILFTLPEMIVVGCFNFGKHKRLFLLDGLYWLAIGIPTAIILYDTHHHQFGPELNIFIYMLLVNALYNLILADLAVSYLPYEKLLGAASPQELPYVRMVLQIAVLAVIGPILLFMLMSSSFIDQFVHRDITSKLTQTAVRFNREMSGWSTADRNSLLLHDALQVGRAQGMLQQLGSQSGNLTLTDGNHLWLAGYEPLRTANGQTGWLKQKGNWQSLGGNLYVWLPGARNEMFTLQQWANAWYVYADDYAPLHLYISLPASGYQREAYRYYNYQYRTMLIFLLWPVWLPPCSISPWSDRLSGCRRPLPDCPRN